MPKPKQTVRLSGADAQALADWAILFYRHNEVACLMLGTMSPKLYQQFEHNFPLEMVTELQKIYGKPPGVKLQELPIVDASSTPQVMPIQGARVQKYKPQGKAKGKGKGKGKGPQNSFPTKPKKPQPYKKELMSLATLPLSFWNYALESDAHILNMVPTKKFDKTPYKLCHGKVHNLSYLKGDLNELANYKAALSDPEFEKWLVAMNDKMKSMYDNKVWRLVVFPPNAKVVKSKWIYKKKTDIDGKVHIYKARLVAKGCTQTYGVDFEETFSPIADIRAIRILIAIAAYYDYEIWQMDVKIAFLNGFLEEEIYMEQPEEMKRMQNVPYASAVGSIMYVVRCTRPDVAFAQNITSRFQQNFVILKQSYELTIIAMLDSKPIEMTQNLKLGIQKGVRHFKRKYHYVRECIETGEIDIVKVHTNDNLADPFTKALAGPKLTRHARSMDLRPASSFM
nr:putative retrotransposon Ty1-copia subclass protein [Tanacetum cinerariifolium]